jgi:hypothetical protein
MNGVPLIGCPQSHRQGRVVVAASLYVATGLIIMMIIVRALARLPVARAGERAKALETRYFALHAKEVHFVAADRR